MLIEVITKLDRRTKEARLLAVVRRDLTAHIGGNASAAETALIERAALLSLHLARFDARELHGDGLTDGDRRTYLRYSDALARTVKVLGLKPRATAVRAPTLAEAAAEGRREREEGRFAA